jgi:hypothetical protein
MIAYYVMDDRLARLFGVESLQQPPQLLETQFEFLGHLQPRGLRDVGMSSPPYSSSKSVNAHLSAEKTRQVYRFSSGKSPKVWSAASSPAALLLYALLEAIDKGLYLFRSREVRVPAGLL